MERVYVVGDQKADKMEESIKESRNKKKTRVFSCVLRGKSRAEGKKKKLCLYASQPVGERAHKVRGMRDSTTCFAVFLLLDSFSSQGPGGKVFVVSA